MRPGRANWPRTPDVRRLFTREYLLASDWYAARLKARQAVEGRLWQRHVRYLESFLKKPNYAEEAIRLGIDGRLERARQELARAESPARLANLAGTLGAEPIEKFSPIGTPPALPGRLPKFDSSGSIWNGTDAAE